MQLLTKTQFDELARKFKPLDSVSEDEGNSSFFNVFCAKFARRFDIGRFSQKISINDEFVLGHIKKFARQFEDHLRFVGSGSSRVVFALSDGTAIKVAFNGAGIAQNKQEVGTIRNMGENALLCFPKIYDVGCNGAVVLTDCATPGDKDGKFMEDVCDLRFCLVSSFVRAIQRRCAKFRPKISLNQKKDDAEVLLDEEDIENLRDWTETSTYGFYSPDDLDSLFIKFTDRNYRSAAIRSLRVLVAALLSTNDESAAGDLLQGVNWGTTLDPKTGEKYPIVIDIGASAEVMRKHY